MEASMQESSKIKKLKDELEMVCELNYFYKKEIGQKDKLLQEYKEQSFKAFLQLINNLQQNELS